MKRRLTDYFSKSNTHITDDFQGHDGVSIDKIPSDSKQPCSNNGLLQRMPTTSNVENVNNCTAGCETSKEQNPTDITSLTNYQLYDIGLAVGKILDDDKKLKYLNETWKPPVSYSFPTRAEGKQNRKFRREWLEQYNWLAYSELSSGGFCKMCVLFAPTGAGIGNQVLKTFVKEPLIKFKKATEELKYHQTTQYHQFSVEKALHFKQSMEPIPGSSVSHVGLLIDARKASIIEQNLKRLKPIVKTVLFCAHNNLPLRGHRDDGNLNSREEQENALRGNQGVFKSLLAFRIDAGDEDLKTHLTTCRKNSTHISKTIQNDIIECIGDYIRSEITSSIQKAKYFSIICDETTDESKKEQLTFCVRYVDIDSFTTREDFLGFVELKATTGLSIKSAIDEELTKLNLSYKYLCGQGYDGASNMSGPFKGVQALISEQQPLAIYTHCFSHSLNLCITKSCQIPVIRNVMGTVETVSVFLSASAHRTNALIDVVEKQDFSETKKKRLKALCPTRWVERHDSLITFKELLVPVVTVLESLHTTASSEASTKAYMLNASIKRSEFIVGVEISVYCLSLTLRLSQQLQSPKQDLSSALANVSQVLDTFRSVRQNAELEFQTIYKNCLEIAEELDLELEIPRSGKRKSARDCTPPENPEVYFRRSLSSSDRSLHFRD